MLVVALLSELQQEAPVHEASDSQVAGIGLTGKPGLAGLPSHTWSATEVKRGNTHSRNNTT